MKFLVAFLAVGLWRREWKGGRGRGGEWRGAVGHLRGVGPAKLAHAVYYTHTHEQRPSGLESPTYEYGNTVEQLVRFQTYIKNLNPADDLPVF